MNEENHARVAVATCPVPVGTKRDLTGERFARYVVVGFVRRVAQPGKGWKRWWLCRCDCGEFRVVQEGNLRSGMARSCGCFKRDNARALYTTHGATHTPLYRRYRTMVERCENPRNAKFPRYGGRGITVCARWRAAFEAWRADMGEPPPGATIERRENDAGYWCGHCEECLRLARPANCRWANAVEQGRNKRNNRMMTFGGETLCVSEWAARLNVSMGTLWSRLDRGMSDAETLTRPFRKLATRTREIRPLVTQTQPA